MVGHRVGSNVHIWRFRYATRSAKNGAFAQRPLWAAVNPKPDGRLPFRVSDAGRRRKVVDARTRGPRSVCYGDFDFARRCKLIDAVHMQTVLRADRPLFGWRCGCSNADGPILAGLSPLLRMDCAPASNAEPHLAPLNSLIGHNKEKLGQCKSASRGTPL